MAAGQPSGPHRFLTRNRVIAALACGTVIVEAGERSGALNTARHAADLGKPLMAVPGPVTSAQSAGCHRIIREWSATCVTRAAEIIEMLSPLSIPDPLAPGGGPQPSAGVAHTSVYSAGVSSADAPRDLCGLQAPMRQAPTGRTPGHRAAAHSPAQACSPRTMMSPVATTSTPTAPGCSTRCPPAAGPGPPPSQSRPE